MLSRKLAVQDAAVGDDDDRVEDGRVVARRIEFDQLVRRPGDGVGLARAGRMLDEIGLARPMFPRRGPTGGAPRRAGGSGGRRARFLASGSFFLPMRTVKCSRMLARLSRCQISSHR